MNTTKLIRERDFYSHAMQLNSPNPGLHMTKQGLTDRSKAMAGEREEDAA